MTFFWQNPVLQGNARMSDVRNVDQLAEMFDLPSWEKVEEMNADFIMDRASQLAEGVDDEEAIFEGQREAQQELYENWHNSVLSAAEAVFSEYDLTLVPKGRRQRRRQDPLPYEYRVQPETSWEDSARKIMQTVNGVGVFYFSSLREFLDSGPYTARQAVLSHLVYVSQHEDVYGSPSARRIYEGAWRR